MVNWFELRGGRTIRPNPQSVASWSSMEYECMDTKLFDNFRVNTGKRNAGGTPPMICSADLHNI
ncbi:hypothetical protein NECAME_12799 [Necator americanus]|uniref:Uncharacterized protein n=1 Tax=Necator americanus TaxID=51031 RepID=W2SY44_NECAM|nr:hypothetical protein NECAME_12799 [Necator americanus]ETN74689.1 hypothetical protein NECAME_12799 [Necator americanus]